jgi:excisionase family DNA binding protein
MSHRATNLDDIRTGPPTLDVGTAAGPLGISRSYAYELVKRGKFPCRVIQVGSRYRVPRTALLALLEGSPTGETA